MLNKFLKMNQPVCIVIWLAIVYNLLYPLGGIFYTILLYAGPVLLIVHFSEWIFLRAKLKQLGHTGFGTFTMVMLYGFFWWLPVIRSDNPPGPAHTN